MSGQKLLFIALLSLMMTVAWTLPTQSLSVTNTSSARKQLIKEFVAKVQELIKILMQDLLKLPVTR
ncbi:uncharacterized protein LOC27207645 [Drosophila simulans]|uniref:Uncharacterized protein LOC117147953 n=1 Tax=Drosophila mauritiana TaxID=7226 RepID=A0A6P8KWZ2_DROMA|nr:uncharacterized protein LOC27207645 [Drosophila simulans]XP_033170987.1 uncharacterized protein LOC117147953 [Drosophila mauritiana]KMZ08139.1 uncharacterized protein Dsimw501_GD27796 [Drosophila simulans]